MVEGLGVARPGTSTNHLERLTGWGRASHSISYVYHPTTVDEIRDIFKLAQENQLTVGFRGQGKSYGDAAQNGENIILQLDRMNRILDWNPAGGQIKVEPGVTLQRLWEYVIGDGWWPPVCTGTMGISLGGGASMNAHGKNAWKLGPIGDHITEFELLLPSGERKTCNRETNSDLFHAAIGGFGMLGCFTSLTLQMKRVYSGLLNVEALASANLAEMMAYFEANMDEADYLVGWIDAFATGKKLGRGQIHRADYLRPGEDPNPNQTLQITHQAIPHAVAGVFPKFWLPFFMRPFYNNLGWRLVCWAKYMASRILEGNGKKYRQPHAHFHFLLDAIPFRNVFGKGGIIQYQAFVPAGDAHATLSKLLKIGHKYRLPNYLSVLKRHRSDPFLMTHGLDGYSLAMDFHITDRNRTRMAHMAREMDSVVLSAGGRFYFAKDSTLRPEVVQAYLGEEAISQFRALKQQCDPDNLLETNLWRRLFPIRD